MYIVNIHKSHVYIYLHVCKPDEGQDDNDDSGHYSDDR